MPLGQGGDLGHLAASQVSVSILGRSVLHNVTVAFREQQFVAVVGPNGSGKSTLVRALLGLIKVDAGEIFLSGRSISLHSRNSIARSIGYVAQEAFLEYPLTVADVVMMGRTPYLGRFQMPADTDFAAVDRAMADAGVAHLANRPINQLSAGERQRSYIARAVAQEAPSMILDEPISSLDLGQQLRILELLRSLADQGRSVVAVLHDLVLAARFCDRIVLVSGGQIAADGVPTDVITADNLLAHFGLTAVLQKSLDGKGLLIWPLASGCTYP